MGDLNIELPNRSDKTKVVFKNAIHALEMVFTLISISQLDKAGYSIIFNKGMCTGKNPKTQTIATIPNSNGLYKIATPIASDTKNMANIVFEKMSISQAHKKLGHILYSAIKHAISQGFITGIKLNPESKPNFCDACAKAKSAYQPFPKEPKLRAEKFGKQVHWDLWGPATDKSLNTNSYMAAHIDDATCESKLYFQDKKSQTFDSYKLDKVYIETQTGHQIKVVRLDQGGEFLSDAMVNH